MGTKLDWKGRSYRIMGTLDIYSANAHPVLCERKPLGSSSMSSSTGIFFVGDVLDLVCRDSTANHRKEFSHFLGFSPHILHLVVMHLFLGGSYAAPSAC